MDVVYRIRGVVAVGGSAAKANHSGSRPFRLALVRWPASYGPRMANRYEYSVVELREGMIGGKMSGDKLENVLNQHAAQGWQLKAITSVEVKGRVGPGGVEGLLVTFERQVG
jgi:hypothetical protein